MALLLAETRPKEWPIVAVQANLDDPHPAVRRAAKSIGNRARKGGTMVSSKGKNAFVVEVSDSQRDRTLRILGGDLEAFLGAGARLIPGRPDGPPVHLEVVGQFASFRIDEKLERSLREPTATERAVRRQHKLTPGDTRN